MNPLLLLLTVTTALGPVAMQIYLPALPLVKDALGATTANTQLTISLYMVAVALATLGYGALSDRYGRKPMLLLGLVLFIGGSIACFFSSSLHGLIAARIIQAIGGAAGMVIARAVIRDSYPAAQAPKYIAQLTMVMVIAPMLSPALGTQIMHHWHWRGVFVFTTVIGSLSLFWVLFRLNETLKPQTTAAAKQVKLLQGFMYLLKQPRYCAYASYTACSSIIFFGFIAATPYIMVQALQRPPNEYGYYFIMVSLAYMTGNFCAVKLSGKHSINLLIYYGSGIAIIGLALCMICFSSGLQSPVVLFAGISLSLLGTGMAGPNAQAGALNVAPQLAGTASGLTGFLQMGSGAMAAQFAGLLPHNSVYPMLTLLMFGAIAAISGLRLGLAVEKRKNSLSCSNT